jgi:flagellar basal-body rod protein FlgB
MQLFDQSFDVHATALRLRERRSELLSQNIANIDTPGYKALDFDFHELMKQNQSSGKTEVMNSDVKPRMSSWPTLNGNTVDEQVENTEFAKNSMEYMATIQLLEMKIDGLKSAIRGE